tara:strand:+ start:184 stop:591 length:408 start_codon:yes stop_codon:yes gene_type:complete
MKIEFIQSYNKNCPSWQELLENFNNSVKDKKLIRHNCLGFFFSDEAHKLKLVKNVLDDLKLVTAHLYMNISEDGDTYGRHCDDVDVYYWQVQGKTMWKFDNETYILNSGDLIIIPKGVYHNVVPIGPRAGISMSV